MQIILITLNILIWSLDDSPFHEKKKLLFVGFQTDVVVEGLPPTKVMGGRAAGRHQTSVELLCHPFHDVPSPHALAAPRLLYPVQYTE